MKEIESTNGYKISVSDEDFDYLNQWNWHVVIKDDKPNNVRHSIKGNRTLSMSAEVLKHRQVPYKGLIDHKDRNALNNQFENLRPATKSQNAANVGIRKMNSSGYKGVAYNNRAMKYQARISYLGSAIFLGYFHDPATAAKAYDRAAKLYFKDFAYLNFPEA